jgi:hypothetical protein
MRHLILKKIAYTIRHIPASKHKLSGILTGPTGKRSKSKYKDKFVVRKVQID